MGQDVIQPLPFGYYQKRIYDDSEVYAKFNILNLYDEFSEHYYGYVPIQYHIHRDDLGRWMVCHIKGPLRYFSLSFSRGITTSD